MACCPPPPHFTSVREYSRYFTDAVFWHPFVAEVIARHHLGRVETICAGLPGTNAVFLVNNRYAVKFYPDLLHGVRSYNAEREAYGLVASIPEFPAPALVAYGVLAPDNPAWRWPYLITTLVPGSSVTEVNERIGTSARPILASFAGHCLRRIHDLPLNAVRDLPTSWQPFTDFIAAQKNAVTAKHRRWNSLPEHLAAQVDGYLAPCRLYDPRHHPCLLHGDLNADHVLISENQGQITPTGVIDFGDARVGDRLYDFIALHFGLFCGNKQLLAEALRTYGADTTIAGDFTRRAMCFTLLHEFNVLQPLTQRLQGLHLESLEELAGLLWDIQAPGLDV